MGISSVSNVYMYSTYVVFKGKGGGLIQSVYRGSDYEQAAQCARTWLRRGEVHRVSILRHDARELQRVLHETSAEG
ncbi:hypothetical protein [Corynebacterium mastitidis]|uniref:hypothetical protein n=1 Tax=Corynebacterium mastitidis TaxID=161890 RepID=UPI0003616B37|nr:hypothetical protein [Corynebacterium mastitidis]